MKQTTKIQQGIRKGSGTKKPWRIIHVFASTMPFAIQMAKQTAQEIANRWTEQGATARQVHAGGNHHIQLTNNVGGKLKIVPVLEG